MHPSLSLSHSHRRSMISHKLPLSQYHSFTLPPSHTLSQSSHSVSLQLLHCHSLTLLQSSHGISLQLSDTVTLLIVSHYNSLNALPLSHILRHAANSTAQRYVTLPSSFLLAFTHTTTRSRCQTTYSLLYCRSVTLLN